MGYPIPLKRLLKKQTDDDFGTANAETGRNPSTSAMAWPRSPLTNSINALDFTSLETMAISAIPEARHLIPTLAPHPVTEMDRSSRRELNSSAQPSKKGESFGHQVRRSEEKVSDPILRQRILRQREGRRARGPSGEMLSHSQVQFVDTKPRSSATA